ncbi:TIM44 subunit of mitochondria import inner membrane translocase [Aureobasidium sp. EXF-10727]|nr:TIM44 subunit of mitochondria import inner membrane translocase [Aureobasidium sp. EXF-10727]
MSSLSRQVLLPRAPTNIARNAPSFQGRSAAYRRISTHVLNRSNVTSPLLPSAASTPSRLSSPFLPASVATTFVRSVSFKEMQAERKRQRAAQGSAPKEDAPKPEPAAKQSKNADTKSEPAQKAKKADEPMSEAERIYQATAARDAGAYIPDPEDDAPKKEKKEGDEAEGEAAEGEGAEKKEKKDKKPPPPKHGNKTPWQVFTETLQTEFKESKEWNEGTKQLSGSIHDFTENPNVQKARAAYEKSTGALSSAAGSTIKTTAGAIGKSAAWTWDTSVVKGIRYGAGAVGSGLEKATRPVRETEAYKNVKEVIDDGSSMRYGGWVEKEERRKRREAREAKDIAEGRRPSGEPLVEDPNAGVNVTVHKDAAWKESWREFRDSSKTMQRLFAFKNTYAESENPLISTARSISDRVAGFFAENETAKVIKKFREMDPSFQMEPWLQEMREYILPEVLDAYVKGDTEVLKQWLSAAQYQVYAALMQQYTQHGLVSDGRILDIRNVDVLNARLLEPGDIPVFVIMCRTQEVHVYKNKKTGQLASGMEDKVQQVTYAIGVTRLPEDVHNPETRGWRLIELQKSAREYI